MGYGHVGDGNIHMNIVCDKQNKDKLEEKIEKFIIEYVTSINGSISAEHGLGVHKAKYLREQKNDEVVDTMLQVKKLFDPKNIMNPLKVFDF